MFRKLHKTISREEVQKELCYNDFEFDIAYVHFLGDDMCLLCPTYLSYFKKEVLNSDDDAWLEWVAEQRDNFKYADLFEKYFNREIRLEVDLAEELGVEDEKEFLKLFLEYLGNPPFLVEDYENLDW